MARRLGLARLLDRSAVRERRLCQAMIVQRVLAPGSKLAMSRAFAQSTLAAELGVGGADKDELYAALDWLLARQERIERALARRHLGEGTLVLYDVSSSYFEGRSCPLARLGYSRDGRRGTPQIVYGLLCDRRGCPRSVSRCSRAPCTIDEQNLAEIASEEYPDERLVVCRNPLVAAERARKREDLLQAAGRALEEIARRVEQGALRGQRGIALAVGAVWNRWRVKKHFRLEITDTSLGFSGQASTDRGGGGAGRDLRAPHERPRNRARRARRGARLQ